MGPVSAELTALRELVGSGRVHPLRPLAAPSTLCHRDHFASVGATLLRCVNSLLPMAAPTALIGATPGLLEAIRAELASGRGLGFTRLDVVCPSTGPKHFQLLEVQAGDPSGMGYHDALSELFGQVPALLTSHRRTLETLTPGRRLAIVVARGAVLETDHQLMAEHYVRHGWQARCVDARELRFEGGELLARGERVEVVYRDALDDLFQGEFAPGGAALLQAVRARAVVVMNPFAAALADDKALLEPLSTPSHWGREVAQVLAAHVPCTRVVRHGRIDWEGREVDLPAYVRRAREQLVLKPVDGYGGFGITVGPFATAATWDDALDQALNNPGSYVAQRYQPLPRLPVHLLEEDGTATLREAFVVHSLWYHPSLVGAFTRASAHPVVNVHQGGGLGPVFFRHPFS